MTGNLLLVRSARQLITLRGARGPRRGTDLRELGIVADGAILIHNDTIVDVGPSRRLENLAEARRAINIDAAGRVVMPAFIDSEVHLLAPGLLPEAEPLEAAWHAAARNVTAKSSHRLVAQARIVSERMARHGTAQVEALSRISLEASNSIKALRIHAGVDQRPLSVVSTLLATLTETRTLEHKKSLVDHICRHIVPTVARRKLARFVALSAAAADPLTRRVVDVSQAAGLGVKVFCDELDPAEGIRLSIAARATSVSSLGRVKPAQIRELAAADAIALLTCPQPEQSGERPDVARALVDEGAAIALATGFRPSGAGTYSMQHALYLAVNAMRLHPAEAIAAGTINAAYNQAAGAETGSIEPGKRADFILLNVSDYRELFVRPGINAVHLMVKAGKVVYREADVTG